MVEDKPLVFAPCSRKQQIIMEDDSTDILLIGGGMGGGKTHICLTKFLKYLPNPDTRIVVLRQTQPQLKLPGAIVDASHRIYPHFGGVYKTQQMRWVFPSGAMIQFAAIDSFKALEGFKGSEFTHVLIDEAADWPEDYVTFLMSRIRSSRFKGKMQMVMSCNPDNNSFLFRWVEWCLDADGVPLAGTENRTRWCVTLAGKTYWGDSAEELYKEYGYGKTVGKDFICRSVRFIPCGVYDNRVLLRNQPEYLANLLAQNRVNQLRFLHGSWTAKAGGSGYWKREWCKIVDRPPDESLVVQKIRGYDLAASPEPDANSTNRNPDFTAGVLVSRDKFGHYYVEHVDKYRKSSGDVIQKIINTALTDGLEHPVGIPRDSGAGGVSFFQHLTRTLTEHGLTVKMDKVSGHAGKLQRFLPFAGMCEAGNVSIVRGDWNEMFFDELEAFEGGKQRAKDDVVDGCSTAFNLIAKQMHMPSFSLPDFSRASLTPT